MPPHTALARVPANRCSRVFLGVRHDRNERRTWWVVWLTAVMMIGEIVGGALFGSMALMADGWHMATHAAALTVAALAYRYARRHRDDPRFAFGTGKVGELAGFASAVSLGIVSLLILWESLVRLVEPRAIRFDEAIVIAVIGLVVNLASARLLHDGHAHEPAHPHGHRHGHDNDHEHPDHDDQPPHGAGQDPVAAPPPRTVSARDSNLHAAYLHVLADAVTSVLAIVALLAGRWLGWVWLDAVIGIVGAAVIAYWSWNLMRTASQVLLDVSTNERLIAAVTARLESAQDTITDLHLWPLGPGHSALIVSLTSDAPAAPDVYKARLRGLKGLFHVTIEVNGRR